MRPKDDGQLHAAHRATSPPGETVNIYDPANDIVYVHLAQQPQDPEIGVGSPACSGRPSDAAPASNAESHPGVVPETQ
jgi:hypothetical protein